MMGPGGAESLQVGRAEHYSYSEYAVDLITPDIGLNCWVI